MRGYVVAAIAAMTPTFAAAETIQLNIVELPSGTVYETAQATPLAITAEGVPAVLLLRVPAGNVVPPHATESGLRLLTVVEGQMSWGDGDTVEPLAERVYGPGSFLMLPAGVPHWLAARDGDVLLQMVLLNGETPTPAV